MQTCMAVKNIKTFERCCSKTLHGFIFCNRHARMRSPTLWIETLRVHEPKVIRAQACVRGWIARLRLRLAGPGVLCRKNLMNDEELITMTAKDRQHPLDFISFEEQGKVWWFSFSSLWKWCSQSPEPINPYTNVAIDSDTMKRVYELYYFKRRHREALPSIPPIDKQINQLCHLFHMNGFLDVHPSELMQYQRSEYISIFMVLNRDLQFTLSAEDPIRPMVLDVCRHMHDSRVLALPGSAYVLYSCSTLQSLMGLYKNSYTIVFLILSALYRC
jgi:hypothetical protein